MAYTLWKFGGIVLPTYNRTTKATPARPRTALVATASGVFDAWGSGRAQAKFPHSITLECTLAADDVATWRSSLDALRAAVGTRALLYRVADDDGAVHKCTARLSDMQYSQAGRLARHQQITLAFEQLDHWRGRVWADWTLDDGVSLDDGYYFDVGGIDLPVLSAFPTVGGNLPAVDVRVTVTVGATAPDNLQIYTQSNPRCVVTIDDALTPGDVYYIDSSARLATKNGADAYDVINLDEPLLGGTEMHEANEWLVLQPGELGLNLALDSEIGGNATGTLEFVEAWA